jgi:hypothetical protein
MGIQVHVPFSHPMQCPLSGCMIKRTHTHSADEMAAIPAISDKATVECLMLMLDGLIGLVYSGDVWALAYYRAKNRAKKMGISDSEFESVHARFTKMRRERQSGDPIASCFSD